LQPQWPYVKPSHSINTEMCTIIALLLSMANCLPPDPRPLYNEIWSMYGAAPDCLNRDRHIRYLNNLKTMPMRTGDTVSPAAYNASIDLYVERVQTYCETK